MSPVRAFVRPAFIIAGGMLLGWLVLGHTVYKCRVVSCELNRWKVDSYRLEVVSTDIMKHSFAFGALVATAFAAPKLSARQYGYEPYKPYKPLVNSVCLRSGGCYAYSLY